MSESHEKLNNLQSMLDEVYLKYAKQDFELKYKTYKIMKPILEDRNEYIKNMKDFWSIAAQNYETILELLPLENNEPNSKFIKNINVWFEPDFICGTEIILNNNEYVSNKILKKRFSIIDDFNESTNVVWKNYIESPIFTFFEEENGCIDIFDIFYELYVNGIYYHSLECEN